MTVKRVVMVFAICALAIGMLSTPCLAIDPLDLHWDLSQWNNYSTNEVTRTPTSRGLLINVHKKNWCDIAWTELPSKARYLSNFTLTANVENLEGGNCGLSLANKKTSFVFYVSRSNAEIRFAASEKVSRVQTAKLEGITFPATLSLTYNTSTGDIKGSVNNKIVLEVNADDNQSVPKISFISYCGVVLCSPWNSYSAKATFSTLDLKAW